MSIEFSKLRIFELKEQLKTFIDYRWQIEKVWENMTIIAEMAFTNFKKAAQKNIKSLNETLHFKKLNNLINELDKDPSNPNFETNWATAMSIEEYIKKININKFLNNDLSQRFSEVLKTAYSLDLFPKTNIVHSQIQSLPSKSIIISSPIQNNLQKSKIGNQSNIAESVIIPKEIDFTKIYGIFSFISYAKCGYNAGIKLNAMKVANQNFSLSLFTRAKVKCMYCKQEKALKEMLLLNCGCRCCTSCLRLKLYEQEKQIGCFTSIYQAKEKNTFSAFSCIKHKKIIPLTIVSKVLSVEEIESFQLKAILNSKIENSGRKDWMIERICLKCKMVISHKKAIQVCQNKHFSCENCTEKITKENKNKKICPLIECRSIISFSNIQPIGGPSQNVLQSYNV